MEYKIEQLLKKDSFGINDLVDIVIILRSENGCPWDKVQTHSSIKMDFLEEVYEAIDAIDQDSSEMMREELGDVLLQVVFHTVIEDEKGNFELDDVISDICMKLIIRHPHVFGDTQADTVEKVLSNWDSIKKQTKNQATFSETLRSVPKNFPALMRAEKLGKRAGRAEIDFDSDENNCQSELIEEVKNSICDVEKNSSKENIGRLLFLSANLARKYGYDAEEILLEANEKFIKKFDEIEKSGVDLNKVPVKELYNF